VRSHRKLIPAHSDGAVMERVVKKKERRVEKEGGEVPGPFELGPAFFPGCELQMRSRMRKGGGGGKTQRRKGGGGKGGGKHPVFGPLPFAQFWSVLWGQLQNGKRGRKGRL